MKYDLVKRYNRDITLKELLPGDILMTHGERWLSEKIQYFMKVQGHKWYGVDMYEWFNHMATVVEPAKFACKTIIGEAIASGYNLHPISKKYANESINRMVVARPLKPFNSVGLLDISSIFQFLAIEYFVYIL